MNSYQHPDSTKGWIYTLNVILPAPALIVLAQIAAKRNDSQKASFQQALNVGQTFLANDRP